MRNNLRQRHSDYWLSLAVFGLIGFGLIMIYSVSKYYSLDLTNGATDKYYLKKQLGSLLIGIVAWIVFQAINYQFWKKYLGHLFFITLGLLLLPLILHPFGITSGGRWIVLGGFNFQPAELAKLTFVIYLSGLFANHDKNLKDVAKLFWPFIMIVGSIAAIMLIQKDLGTLAIFVVIASVIFIFAGAPFHQLFAATGSAAFLLWLAIKIEPYRMQRLTTFLNPGSDTSSSGYHIQNALIAIGSGGLWGLGFGQSKQKYLYLPEAHTDSIFAIICEELGMVRASLVILVFAFIGYRGLKIAKNAPDTFSRLMAIGITSWLFFQMAINIAAMFSLVPLTGIPLPFISYGGTSLIVLLSAVGVLTNISKYQIYDAKK
jgi:cell division protein FtsW